MRIGVLRTQVPFVTGGAERHAANLVSALNAWPSDPWITNGWKAN